MEGIFGESLAIAALVVFWYMTGLFLAALARRDNSLADIAWGPGFLLAALAVLWWQRPAGLLPVLATTLVAAWAVRLGVHIWMRNWGRGEDWRYARWRGRWGQWWPLRSYLQVFLLQGVLLLVVCLPALAANTYGGPVGWLAVVGSLLWLTGFLWETFADYQLMRFQKDPRNAGKVLQSGVWAWSRHPNYFGEVTLWWGMGLIALSTGAWWALAGPLVITFLILKVSGVPLLESKMLKHAPYRDYARRTSAFIPWFPKR